MNEYPVVCALKDVSLVLTGGRQVFRDITLTLAEGDRVSVLGVNGCGKSSLLRILLGLQSATTGVVCPVNRRMVVSYMPQDYRNALLPWGRVIDNVSAIAGDGQPCDQHGRNAYWARFEGLSERVKLRVAPETKARSLSGGEAQLTLLLSLLLRSPQILFLDEPLSSVDAMRRALVLSLLHDYFAEQAATCITVSHDADEAAMLATTLHVMGAHHAGHLGRVIVPAGWPRSGDPQERALIREAAQNARGLLWP